MKKSFLLMFFSLFMFSLLILMFKLIKWNTQFQFLVCFFFFFDLKCYFNFFFSNNWMLFYNKIEYSNEVLDQIPFKKIIKLIEKNENYVNIYPLMFSLTSSLLSHLFSTQSSLLHEESITQQRFICLLFIYLVVFFPWNLNFRNTLLIQRSCIWTW